MTIRFVLPSGQHCNMRTICIFSNYKLYGFAFSINVIQIASCVENTNHRISCLLPLCVWMCMLRVCLCGCVCACMLTVSIGRRVQDPLAELVKIDPKHIGIGTYQVSLFLLFLLGRSLWVRASCPWAVEHLLCVTLKQRAEKKKCVCACVCVVVIGVKAH